MNLQGEKRLGETAQCVKCFLSKSEDLRMEPQQAHKRRGQQCIPVTPVLGEGRDRQIIEAHWPVGLVEVVGSGFRERQSQKLRWI